MDRLKNRKRKKRTGEVLYISHRTPSCVCYNSRIGHSTFMKL